MHAVTYVNLFIFQISFLENDLFPIANSGAREFGLKEKIETQIILI
jgi:hypothetical protein